MISCRPDVQKRPPGYIKLGKVAEMADAETFFGDKRLLLRRDLNGFYVMSTECTYDLSPLVRKTTEGGAEVFYSPYSGVTYALDGAVVSGQAKAPLPYYKLEFNRGVIDGPVDTLYVKVGEEVPAGWRLQLARS